MFSGGVRKIALLRDPPGGTAGHSRNSMLKSCLYQLDQRSGDALRTAPHRPQIFHRYFKFAVPFNVISADEVPTRIWDSPGSTVHAFLFTS